ncbi:pilus assembly protein CpaD [Rhodopseudomonas boonkerdii]|uniref:CpaD family pilus assembly protein n=1 Tax=Rhodopseudomonas boonkerdii TaxID=475937 RepID=UPI001E49A84B|nr:CpaD family pilus assembly protein [Rhodopseudomonas boonkerdii]UGV28006.1 pilus assembly protein CpaD [Rhodopseudomonas boonkerdii]
MTQTSNIPRSLALAAAIVGATIALGGCRTVAQDDVATSVPSDYRLRHPIVVEERLRSTEVFVGSFRGGLTATQRADVIAVGQSWLREGTGVITVEVPAHTPNARAAQESNREIRSLLAATGVPANAVAARTYTPNDPRQFATIRLGYPLVAATAGPCGTWPEDLSASIKNKSYISNRPYYNLGCASQRNLAAMVSNPSDLVQPRPETPVYAARRTYALDKYRQGQATVTTYPDADKNKISNVGQ